MKAAGNGDIQVKLGDQFFPLGKIESIDFLGDNAEIPDNALGIDMTGFAFGTTQELTATIEIENPLKLKLQLLDIPVVNVILCKNCAKRYTTRCPAWKSNFGDNDTCSKGVLKNDKLDGIR